jgi:hypothetical protein
MAVYRLNKSLSLHGGVRTLSAEMGPGKNPGTAILFSAGARFSF